MKELLITLSLVACLVLFGFLGSVYGQNDSLKQNLDSIQDTNKSREILFYNPDLNKYLNNGDDYSNHTHKIRPSHNGYDYSSHTHESRPTNLGYATGMYYQQGFYGGNNSNYISSHSVFYYPIANFDFFVKKFVFQFFLIGDGRSKVIGVNIHGDIFKGTFCGEYLGLNMAMGYEVFSNSYFSIIPNIGFQVHKYTVYSGADPGIIGHGNPLTKFTVTSYSFGFMADYKILKMNVHDENKMNYVSVRFKYDYCLPTGEEEYFSGNAHQFTVGLTATLRGKKSK